MDLHNLLCCVEWSEQQGHAEWNVTWANGPGFHRVPVGEFTLTGTSRAASPCSPSPRQTSEGPISGSVVLPSTVGSRLLVAMAWFQLLHKKWKKTNIQKQIHEAAFLFFFTTFQMLFFFLNSCLAQTSKHLFVTQQRQFQVNQWTEITFFEMWRSDVETPYTNLVATCQSPCNPATKASPASL